MAALDQQQKKNKLVTNPVAVCLLAMLSCALWGSAFPVIKLGYSLWRIETGDWASQILFAGIRFTLAGVLTLLFGSAVSGKVMLPKKASLAPISVLALFQTVLQYLFFYVGLARTTGTRSSILDSVSVFFSVLIVTLILKQECLTAQKLVGCLLGFCGVVLINFTGGVAEGFSFFGEGFILLSALSYAVSSVLIKRYSQAESPVVLSGCQFALGGAVMTAGGLLLGGRLGAGSLSGIAVLLYLALLSAAAYTVWGILLKYNPVSGVTVYSFMIPVFGCLFSALLLHESLRSSAVITIVSLVLVSLGILLVNRRTGNKETFGE